jgi:hypothetical protein
MRRHGKVTLLPLSGTIGRPTTALSLPKALTAIVVTITMMILWLDSSRLSLESISRPSSVPLDSQPFSMNIPDVDPTLALPTAPTSHLGPPGLWNELAEALPTGRIADTPSMQQAQPQRDQEVSTTPLLLSGNTLLRLVPKAVPFEPATAIINTQLAVSVESPPIPEKVPTLISEGRPAISDVRGNLGPASVVTSEVVKDWLKDRWQAAKNMQGVPIPGPHWIEVDLERACKVFKVLVDYETAYSADYAVFGRNIDEGWISLADSKKGLLTLKPTNQHIVHELATDSSVSVRNVKLSIRSIATRWGVSVWRFQIWGVCADSSD